MTAPKPERKRCLFVRCTACYPPEPEPAPSAEPELSRDYRLGQLCQSLGVLPLDLAVLLSRAGLAIVKASDVPSGLARDVLQACESYVDAPDSAWRRIRSAELTEKAMRYVLNRRASKETKTDG